MCISVDLPDTFDRQICCHAQHLDAEENSSCLNTLSQLDSQSDRLRECSGKERVDGAHHKTQY